MTPEEALALVAAPKRANQELRWHVSTGALGTETGAVLLVGLTARVGVTAVDLQAFGRRNNDGRHQLHLLPSGSNSPICRLCDVDHAPNVTHWHWFDDAVPGIETDRDPEPLLSDPLSRTRDYMLSVFCERLNIAGNTQGTLIP